MSEAILNWDRIIHKNVRSSDSADVGNVISVSGDSMTVMQGAKRLYKIPKNYVEGFNGSEVFLTLPFSELANYKIQ